MNAPAAAFYSWVLGFLLGKPVGTFTPLSEITAAARAVGYAATDIPRAIRRARQNGEDVECRRLPGTTEYAYRVL